MIYNFKCKLKGHEFNYKTEADSLPDAMVKVRKHIANTVELELFKPEQFGDAEVDRLKSIFGMK